MTIAISSGRAAIQEQLCKMMQNTTLINMFEDVSQFRLGYDALWDASVYKVYEVWMYCEISCNTLLKKLKVLGTEAYIWLRHAICKPHKDAVYLSGTAWMDTLSSCTKGIAISVSLIHVNASSHKTTRQSAPCVAPRRSCQNYLSAESEQQRPGHPLEESIPDIATVGYLAEAPVLWR